MFFNDVPRKAVEFKSSTCRPPISSLHNEKEYNSYRVTEPQNKEACSGNSTYKSYTTRMNSHICHWSPSFIAAITWRRRKGNMQLKDEPESKENNNRHVPQEKFHHYLVAPKALVISAEKMDSFP